MYAHVTTYRLSTGAEVQVDMERSRHNGETVSDQSARTIASWWHAPSPRCEAITALSHGLPFDTDQLRTEIAREITEPNDAEVLTEWLDNLESILTAD